MATITFVSQRRKVYQNGALIAEENFNPRGVLLEYSPMGDRVNITIVAVKWDAEEQSFVEVEAGGILRTKRARIVSDDGRVLRYVCIDDPGFEFTIETKADNTIRCFTLIRKDTGKKYEYYDQ